MLFRQLNYWRSASYVTCFALHVNLHELVTAYTHACLQCMLCQRFIPSWLQGNLQLRRGRTINKHSKAFRAKYLEQSTLTTRLRRRTLVSSRRHISKLMVLGFVGRCSYSEVRLICSKGWLYTCVMAFRHIYSVGVVNHSCKNL